MTGIITQYIKKNTHESWHPILNSCLNNREGHSLFKILTKDKDWQPGFSSMLRAFQETPLSELKVVILGQDPYPQKGVATGIAFANSLEQEKLSPSLKVIIEELQNDQEVNEFTFFDKVDLLHWCRQWVLLLNSSLSVQTNNAGSHAKLWEPIISRFCKELSLFDSDILWVLLGQSAKSFRGKINSSAIITECHPAADTYNDKYMFRNSKIFSRINDKLNSYGKTNVRWC